MVPVQVIIVELENPNFAGEHLDHLLLDFNRHIFQVSDGMTDLASLLIRRHSLIID